MTSCNPVTLPLDSNCKFKQFQEGDNIADPTLYQQIIGSLMYLIIGIRLDLAFSVSPLSQYTSQPSTTQRGSAKRVLRYIKYSRDKVLTYTMCPDLSLSGFADVDFAYNQDDRKSIADHIFELAMYT